MGWRILYLEESDSISLYLDNVKVKRGVNEYLFPIGDLIMILVDNLKTSISVGLMNSCSDKNVPIVCCDNTHHPSNITLSLRSSYECSKMLFKQLKWSKEDIAILWKIIIKRKIANQRFVISLTTKDKETINLLTKYEEEVTPNDETNREGLAAKSYFRSLFGTSFHRDDENVINASLNYGYSIFRALISRIIVAKGLNPQLGLFHKGPNNPFNLTDDILEIFRPIVDLFVYQNFKDDKIFVKDHRLKLLKLINYKIEIDGKKQTINHSMEMIIDEIINFFDKGKVDRLIQISPLIYDL